MRCLLEWPSCSLDRTQCPYTPEPSDRAEQRAPDLVNKILTPTGRSERDQPLIEKVSPFCILDFDEPEVGIERRL